MQVSADTVRGHSGHRLAITIERLCAFTPYRSVSEQGTCLKRSKDRVRRRPTAVASATIRTPRLTEDCLKRPPRGVLVHALRVERRWLRIHNDT